jgi:hypothetical protein
MALCKRRALPTAEMARGPLSSLKQMQWTTRVGLPVLFRSNELCNPTNRACVIAKHRAPSFACPRLAAEWSSQNGRHERAFGRGARQWPRLPDQACNGDNDVTVFDGRYRDCSTRNAFG